MSTHPRLEARVSAQERRQINLDARIEELSEDVTSNFKKLSEDMTASFKQLSEYIGTVEDRFNKIEGDIATITATQKEHTTLLTQILERLPKAP